MSLTHATAPPLTRSGSTYQIIGKLGAGGMGRVYLATRKDSQKNLRQVVLKLPLSVRDAVKWRRDFEAEGRIHAQLNHPNIARALEWTEFDGLPCMVSEYVDGFELLEIIRYFRQQRQRVPFHITARIMMQTCQAVHYMHQAKTVDHVPLNIIHRDIDTSNIMLARNGYVKLIDFGVAKHAMQEEKTRPGIYKGKIINFPPDIFMPEKVDHRADIFGLGILLFELLTARRPRHFDTSLSIEEIVRKIKTDPIPVPSEVSGKIPKAFDFIVAKATALNREHRYHSAKEMYDDLRAISKKFQAAPSHLCIEAWMTKELTPLYDRRERRFAALKRSNPLTSISKDTMSSLVSGGPLFGKQIRHFQNHLAALSLRVRQLKIQMAKSLRPGWVPLVFAVGAMMIMTADCETGRAAEAFGIATNSSITATELIVTAPPRTSSANRANTASKPKDNFITKVLPAIPLSPPCSPGLNDSLK